MEILITGMFMPPRGHHDSSGFVEHVSHARVGVEDGSSLVADDLTEVLYQAE